MSLEGTPVREPRGPVRIGWPRSPVHLLFGVLGPVAALVVAVYVQDLGWTLPGALMAFGVTFGVLGWAVPEAIVGPRRVARAVSALLPGAGGLGGFALASLWWGPTWPALLVGFPVGSSIGTNLQRGMFPELVREEERRWGRRQAGLVAGPDDWVPRWRDLVLLIATMCTFVALVIVDVPGVVYVAAGLVSAGLFLVSAILSWRSRRREALGRGSWAGPPDREDAREIEEARPAA
jgi:hypothetical protein